MPRAKARRALIGAVAALALLAAACGGDGGDGKPTLVFADANWESSEIQTRIVAYVIEHGYGYPTDLISGESILLFEGLQQGDVHVFMEFWLPALQSLWDQGVADGAIFRAGQTLHENWQGFVIPQHVKDEHPGLVSVADIRDYAHLFAVGGTHGKARFLNCTVGWACEIINERKLEAYGLSDVVHIVDPGSEAAVSIELHLADEQRRPWLGYAWSPSVATAGVDLYLLEEPPYSDECWETDMACAYPLSRVLIGAHVSLRERAPDVVAFLGAWDYTTDTHHELVRWRTERNASIEDAAEHFLRTQRDVWSAWVPDDVARRVDAALADG